MQKSMRVVLKMALITVVIAVAVIGVMLILDKFSGVEAQQALTKSLMVIAVIAAACLGMIFLARPRQ